MLQVSVLYGVEYNLGTQIREGKRVASNGSTSFQWEPFLLRVALTHSGGVGRSAPVDDVIRVLPGSSQIAGNLLPGSWASLSLSTPAAPGVSVTYHLKLLWILINDTKNNTKRLHHLGFLQLTRDFSQPLLKTARSQHLSFIKGKPRMYFSFLFFSFFFNDLKSKQILVLGVFEDCFN